MHTFLPSYVEVLSCSPHFHHLPLSSYSSFLKREIERVILEVRGCETSCSTDILLTCSFVCHCLSPMSWSPSSYELFSSPSSGNREHRHNPHSESCFPPTPGGDLDCSHRTHPTSDLRAKDSPNPPAAIPL